MLNKLLRILLSIPILPVYALIVWVRNCMFDRGVLKSTRFSVPVISVGNLSTGGTGKTPHIEYLVRIFTAAGYQVGIVTRGYGRKTRRPILASAQHTARDIGDEPRQYIQKFPDLGVMVDANRVRGIGLLLLFRPQTQIILLDDAFQHRYVNPAFSILLTDYSKPYTSDYLLPLGNLRENPKGAGRADSIIVTKCPQDLNREQQLQLKNQLHPLSKQSLFFSKIKYEKIIWHSQASVFSMASRQTEAKTLTCILLTGIANPAPLLTYMQELYTQVVHLPYPDHHDYTALEIDQIARKCAKYSNPVLICTEKDFMRLENSPNLHLLNSIPLGYIPIEIQITDPRFPDYILQKISNIKQNTCTKN